MPAVNPEQTALRHCLEGWQGALGERRHLAQNPLAGDGLAVGGDQGVQVQGPRPVGNVLGVQDGHALPAKELGVVAQGGVLGAGVTQPLRRALQGPAQDSACSRAWIACGSSLNSATSRPASNVMPVAFIRSRALWLAETVGGRQPSGG